MSVRSQLRPSLVFLAVGALLVVSGCSAQASPSVPPASAPGASASASGAPASMSVAVSASPPASVALKPVTVLTDFSLSGVHSPLFAGKAQGYFKAEGIDLTIVAGQGSANSASKVGAGAADFAIADTAAALQTVSKGAKLMLIAAVEQDNPGGLCSIKSRHDIQSFSDLNGLSIGASPGDAYLVPLPYLIKQKGLTPSYTVVSMSPSDRIPSLLASKVDAVACGHHGLPSYEASAQKEGLTLVEFAYADHGFDALGWSLMTRADLISSDPQLVQGFVNAVVKSYQYSIANPQAAVQDFVTANSEQTTAKALPEWQDEIPLLKDPSGKLFASGRMAATVSFVNSAYNTNFTVEQVYTSQFIDKAMASQ